MLQKAGSFFSPPKLLLWMPMDFKIALRSRRSICFLLLIAILAAILFDFGPLLSLEYRAYDWMSRFRHRTSGIPVIIVGIDDTSLEKIGDWPWPRSYIADVINTLSTNGAQILGISVLYREEELNDGLVEIQNLKETIQKKPLIGEKRTLNKIHQLLSETQGQLNHDNRLVAAVRTAHNVVLPLRFSLSGPDNEAPTTLSDWLKLNSIESAEKQLTQNSPFSVPAFLFGNRLNKPPAASSLRSPYAIKKSGGFRARQSGCRPGQCHPQHSFIDPLSEQRISFLCLAGRAEIFRSQYQKCPSGCFRPANQAPVHSNGRTSPDAHRFQRAGKKHPKIGCC